MEVVAIDEHFMCHLICDHPNCSLTTAEGSQDMTPPLSVGYGNVHVHDTLYFVILCTGVTR